jgi:hypothetical protein
VRAEIVLHQHDLARARKVLVGQRLEDLRIVGRSVVISDLDVPPSLQGCEQHEQIGCAVALVLVIMPGWLSGPWRDWHPGFFDQGRRSARAGSILDQK